MKKPGIFTTESGKNYSFIFGLICTLFFLWALCNGMIDVMDKHFQDALQLTKGQSANVQTAHYLGYGLMALPAGWLAMKLGYKGGIITGLMIVALGCLWFIPATKIATFWAFLLGICIVSMGLTFLETIANPYTTVLGSERYAAVRINIAQSANGIGWILGPIIGGIFFYGSSVNPPVVEAEALPAQGIVQTEEAEAPMAPGEQAIAEIEAAAAAQEAEVAPSAANGSENIWIPYAGVAGVVILLALVFLFVEIPDIVNKDSYHLDDDIPVSSKSIWRHWHFVGAVLAQFVYVAAQAGIFSFFINYVVEDMPKLTESMVKSWNFLIGGEGGMELREGTQFVNEIGATKLLAYIGFPLFLLGRFSGAALLSRLAAHRALAGYAFANAILMCVIVAKLGWLSVIALFLSFFFMSIMFPTIFALGIHGLGKKSKIASSFIVMAIMGGATLPKLMGHFGDLRGMSFGFLIPAFCFLIVGLYGALWGKLSGDNTVAQA